MTLNGKGSPRTSSGSRFGGPSSPSDERKPVVETYGRTRRPPRPGSSYWDFEFWATSGGWPEKGDIDLAVRLWSTPAPSDDAEDAAPPPGMR
jgi:hypothetical protein